MCYNFVFLWFWATNLVWSVLLIKLLTKFCYLNHKNTIIHGFFKCCQARPMERSPLVITEGVKRQGGRRTQEEGEEYDNLHKKAMIHIFPHYHFFMLWCWRHLGCQLWRNQSVLHELWSRFWPPQSTEVNISFVLLSEGDILNLGRIWTV